MNKYFSRIFYCITWLVYNTQILIYIAVICIDIYCELLPTEKRDTFIVPRSLLRFLASVDVPGLLRLVCVSVTTQQRGAGAGGGQCPHSGDEEGGGVEVPDGSTY